MKQKVTGVILALLFVVSLGASIQANAADKTSITQVLAIETHGNTATYLEKLKPVLTRNKQLAPKNSFHVYRAGFSGTTTGMIYVVVEYPSMAYLEEVGKKVSSDPEFIKAFKELEKSGRTVESDSILFDVTP